MSKFFILLIGILSAADVFALPPAQVDYDRQIQPILSDRCYLCHGPDVKNRQADLRFDLEASAKHIAIVPGKPNDSEFIRRIISQDPDLHMPPADSNLALTPSEIELLKQWIAQGAPWQQHWAFVRPKQIPVPAVSNKGWPHNPIDHFILARLEQEGWTPAAETTRERLIRRVTFDLTGLPPTLKQMDDFLADKSPEGYLRVVDRLLQSDSYGERMASAWLDTARYSDTYGYQVDRDRYVWPWRDWVVRALNRNMPYDTFITQQLAGDLLPDATADQILATTFNRLHPQKVEGGSTPEEFRIEYVADRTQTFGTAFLGLTLECCRCHEHKYDPLSQADYYQFSAFFDNIDEAGLYSYFTSSVPTPTLLLTQEGQQAKITNGKEAILATQHQLQQIARERRAAFESWRRTVPGGDSNNGLIPGRIALMDFEKLIEGANQSVAGPIGRAVKLSGDDGIGLQVGNFHRSEPFSVALWMNLPDVKQRAVVFHRSRAWTDAASRGYQLLIEEGRLSASLIHFWPGNAIRIRTNRPVPINQWLHVTLTYDGSSRANGLQLFLDGKPIPCTVVRDHLNKNITGGGGDNITIGERFRDHGLTDGLVDEFQVFHRRLTTLEVAQLHDRKSLNEAIEADSITVERGDQLYEYYLNTSDPEYMACLKNLQTLRDSVNQIQDEVREIMVMRELDEPHPTYLLQRGAYDARGEQVTAKTPEFLPAFPQDAPRNRLGLAQWLTHDEHPLTARVAVNRFWQMMFGQGLVRTPEDFGRQGEPPTHANLLDYLAYDFTTHNWNVKRLLRQMVTSATYRQSSRVRASQAMDKAPRSDPENRLLSRMASYRLPAEMLRDNVLATSGLLSRQLGGPPAKPYELEVSFKPVKRDQGTGLYRRSLYTYWKRTGPAPVMMTLDASKRDVCRVRRERTSTPLQAFVLMNSPQFVEATRVLGERLLKQYGDDRESLFTDLFRILTSRRPTAQERQILINLHEQQIDYFTRYPDRATQYLKTGDALADRDIDPTKLAAIAAVTNTLIVFDEAVMKR
ncbi:MAG: DUF1553 domain-containing protein [Pirellulales bacterium]